MNKKKNKKASRLKGVIGPALVILVGVGIVVLMAFLSKDTSRAPQNDANTATTHIESTESSSGADISVDIDREQAPINLGYGLEITEVGSYTGLYMEDGTDDIVSGVMMLVLENKGEDDIQYAVINASNDGESYRFSLTNLAVGEKVVLLELERKPKPSKSELTAVLEDVVCFDEPMSTKDSLIRIRGLDGMMNIENISGEDISGDIYVYYKYSASDVFYGGITFRVSVNGGLKNGELRQLPAAHYSPSGCTVVHVDVAG